MAGRIFLLLSLSWMAFGQYQPAPGTGGGASPAAPNGSVQTRLNSTTFGASTSTGGTAATFGDNATISLKGTISNYSAAASGEFSFGSLAVVSAVNGVQIIDQFNPAVPTVIKTITAHNSPCTNNVSGWSPFIFGKFLYFSCDGNWETWNISNIASPVYISSITIGGEVLCAYIADSTVYLGTFDNHLYIYDITNRAVPKQQAALDLGNSQSAYSIANCMTVSGPHLFMGVSPMTSADPLALIIDVSNPSSPSIVGRVPQDGMTAAYGTSVQVSGTHLFVSIADFNTTCVSDCIVRSYDIKDVTMPTKVGGYGSTGVIGQDLVLSGTTAYSAKYDNSFACPGTAGCGVLAIDVSNPASLSLLSTYDTGASLPESLRPTGKFLSLVYNNNSFDQYSYALLEIPGWDVPSARIGQLQGDTGHFQNDLRTEGGLYAGSFAKIGPEGLGSQGPITGTAYLAPNCTSAASPAVCGTLSTGAAVIAAGATTVVVDTSTVTDNSDITVTENSGLSTRLSVTCNTQSSLVVGTPRVTAINPGVSFTVGVDIAPTATPLCFTFSFIN